MNFFVVLIAVIGITAVTASPRRPKNTRSQEIIGPIDWECEWDGVFAFPDACDKFVECWDNVPNLWQCNNQMLFDTVYLGCNYAQYTHCYERPRPTNVPSTANPTTPTTTSDPNATTTTTQAPPIDFICPGDGVFAHETRCEYYWKCYAGVAELIHCQSDFLFDLVYMGCNFPEYTHCGDRERPPGVKPTVNPPVTTTKTTTTTAPTTTVNTGPTTTRDPSAPTTTTTTTTTTTPKPGFECPAGLEGDFPDPENCSAYYTCLIDGTFFHQFCPEGLHFDPTSDSCDYPEIVQCEVRVKYL